MEDMGLKMGEEQEGLDSASLARPEDVLFDVDSILPSYLQHQLGEDAQTLTLHDLPAYQPQDLHEHERDDFNATPSPPVAHDAADTGDETLMEQQQPHQQQQQRKQQGKSTSKATEQNRKAQQRFRQRQRERINTLSNEVSRLEERVRELETAEQQKQELCRKLRMTYAKVQELEAENEQLREALWSQRLEMPATTSAAIESMASAETNDPPSASSADAYDAYKKEFTKWIQQLRQLLEQYPEDSVEADDALSNCVISALDVCTRIVKMEGSGELLAKSSGYPTLTGALKTQGAPCDHEYWCASHPNQCCIYLFPWICGPIATRDVMVARRKGVAHNAAGITDEQQKRIMEDYKELEQELNGIFDERESLNSKLRRLAHMDNSISGTQLEALQAKGQCEPLVSTKRQEKQLKRTVNMLRANLQRQLRHLSDFESTLPLCKLTTS